MAETKNIFEGVEEPKQVRRLKQAGIHRKVRFTGAEYLAPETKKGENGKADTELSARAQFSFVVPHEIKDSAKGTVLSSQDLILEELKFCPPTKVEEVKFLNDKYLKNNIVGKNTPQEQLKIDWENFGMFLFQLATALSKSQFAIVKTKLVKYAKDYSMASFKGLIEGFEKEFPLSKYGEQLLDIKTVWNNSKEKHTSFLRIAKASGNNIVVATHDPAAAESTLFINEYERKNLKPLYSGADNPPKGTEEIIDEGGKSGLTAGQIVEEVGDDDDLLKGTDLDDQSELF